MTRIILGCIVISICLGCYSAKKDGEAQKSPNNMVADMIYDEILQASGEQEISAALMSAHHRDLERLSPLPPAVFKKIITVLQGSIKSDERILSPTAKLAYCSGSIDLLRVVVYAYGGEAEAELKGTYIEEFIYRYPMLYFSLPDAFELWKSTGRANWGCDEPKILVPILKKYIKMGCARKIYEALKRYYETRKDDPAKELFDLPFLPRDTK